MLRSIAPAIAVAVVVCGMGVPARATDSAERAVRAVEQKWLENEDSPAVLEGILADDFVHVLQRRHPHKIRNSRIKSHFSQKRREVGHPQATAGGQFPKWNQG